MTLTKQMLDWKNGRLTTETAIREQAQTLRLLEAQRLELSESIREARKAGATIKQLQEWTGYSRRTIYYLLEGSKS